jgi:uncharacterized iron-regulated membrane protein
VIRKPIFKLHLYAALVSSLFLLVVASTGCLLVFELKMDRWLDRGVSYVSPTNQPVSYDRILALVRDAFLASQVTEIDVGQRDESVIAKTSAGFRVFVNPYTYRIIGTRSGEPPSYWLRHVHRELAGGKTGAAIVNLVTLLLIFQSVSGIYLWWPLKRTQVKFGASLRRVSFDLHNAIGFFSSVFIFMLASTGLIKSYGDQLQPLFDRITGAPAMTRALASNPSGAQIGMDQAVAAAQRELPGAAVARLTPPKGEFGSYLVSMKFPGDSTAPGRSWVVIDQYSAKVLGSQDARTAPAGAQVLIVNRAIHVGGLYGVATRILVFLVSLGVILQTLTGIVLWRKKRASKATPVRVAGARVSHPFINGRPQPIQSPEGGPRDETVLDSRLGGRS